MTPPRVIVLADEDLAVGEFGIATRMVEPDPAGDGGRPTSPSPTVGAPPATPALTSTPAVTMIYRSEENAPPPAPVKETATLSLDGRQLTVGPRTVIGRSRECEIRLDDANVSRRHCEVVEDSEGWSLVDLGSTNGTELNGQPVDRAELSDGDTITVGGSDLIFGLTRS